MGGECPQSEHLIHEGQVAAAGVPFTPSPDPGPLQSSPILKFSQSVFLLTCMINKYNFNSNHHVYILCIFSFQVTQVVIWLARQSPSPEGHFLVFFSSLNYQAERKQEKGEALISHVKTDLTP